MNLPMSSWGVYPRSGMDVGEMEVKAPVSSVTARASAGEKIRPESAGKDESIESGAAMRS
jgi:hypothetical protein